MKALLLEESPDFPEASDGADLDQGVRGALAVILQKFWPFYQCEERLRDNSRENSAEMLAVFAHATFHGTFMLLIKDFGFFWPLLGPQFKWGGCVTTVGKILRKFWLYLLTQPFIV